MTVEEYIEKLQIEGSQSQLTPFQQDVVEVWRRNDSR